MFDSDEELQIVDSQKSLSESLLLFANTLHGINTGNRAGKEKAVDLLVETHLAVVPFVDNLADDLDIRNAIISITKWDNPEMWMNRLIEKTDGERNAKALLKLFGIGIRSNQLKGMFAAALEKSEYYKKDKPLPLGLQYFL